MSNAALLNAAPNAAPGFRFNEEPPARTTPRFVDLLIITNANKLVLIRHKDLNHRWSLPGGQVNDNEQPRDAATREAKAETGLDVSIVRKFGHYSFIDGDGICQGITSVFLAKSDASEARLSVGNEALEACEFSFTELPQLRPEHREIIEDYLRVCDRKTPLPFVRGIRLAPEITVQSVL